MVPVLRQIRGVGRSDSLIFLERVQSPAFDGILFDSSPLQGLPESVVENTSIGSVPHWMTVVHRRHFVRRNNNVSTGILDAPGPRVRRNQEQRNSGLSGEVQRKSSPAGYEFCHRLAARIGELAGRKPHPSGQLYEGKTL